MLKKVRVYVACTNSSGSPDFAFADVEVGEEGFNLGEHYDLAEKEFLCQMLEKPFVMFDELEAPQWLKDNVDKYV